jgi:hypothetical protein
MMAITGIFASDQSIQANRKSDFASSLIMTGSTGDAPLLALSAGMPSAPVSDTIFNWFEEAELTGRQQITNIHSDGTGTTISVTDASSYVPGVVLEVESEGELVLVTAVSTNQLTLQRNLDGGGVTTLTTSMFLQRVGTAYEEGSAMPTAMVNLGTLRFNTVQIFRNAWALTGTASAVQYYTGSRVAKNRADCASQHKEDIERAFIWGKMVISQRNGKPFRLTAGLVEQCTRYGGLVDSESSNTKWSDITSFLQTVFEQNVKGKPNERIAFCGNTVLGVIDRLAVLNSQVNISPGQSTFGMNIRKLMTPYGEITLVTHPLMNQSPVRTQELYVFHPGAIRTRYLRKTWNQDYAGNMRVNGVDADQGVISTEAGIELVAAITSGIYTGMTTAAAEA